MDTFYWHDYETWGVNPALDKPSQFAGVRTDYDFNIVGEPLNILCQPAADTLPHPEACLVTGITPQQAEAGGLAERDFVSAIHAQLAQAGTCSVGYNSIRFDDEVTRYALYRNFYDPYAREWQSGNSRWDIIDMVRLCYAARPRGIEWPMRDNGKPSFQLERLTEANGLAHEAAHDALSDVYATIALAKFIKQQQPKLFDHVFQLRDKKRAAGALALGSNKPVFHISSKFGAEFACGSLVLPVAQHPKNKNEIICVDLRYSPAPLFDCSAEELSTLMYTRVADLPEGIDRIPIKTVHLNRCPIVLTPKIIDDNVNQRVQLDLAQCEANRQAILAHAGLPEKLVTSCTLHEYDNSGRDAEELLYDGFFNDHDKRTMRSIPQADAETLARTVYTFEDQRLPELLFRYRARNFPQSLSEREAAQWREFCYERFTASGDTSVQARLDRIASLRGGDLDQQKLEVLSALEVFLQQKLAA